MNPLAKITAACIFLFSFCTACEKEDSQQNLKIATENLNDGNNSTDGCAPSWWQGVIAETGQTNSNVADNSFIEKGIARIYPVPSNFSYYFTSINLPLGSFYCRHLGGDTLTITVRLKNPAGQPGSVSDNDVNIGMYGYGDTATVTYIGNSRNIQYTKLAVGSIKITNDASLIHLFSDYQTVKLQAFKNTLSTWIDGVLIRQISYQGTSIGSLAKINIGFKGSGSIDWVQINSSNTGKLVMLENFDYYHAAHQIWYF